MHLVQQGLSLQADIDPQTPQQKVFATKTLPALRQAAAAFFKPSNQVVLRPDTVWCLFKTVARSLVQQLRCDAAFA